MESINHVCDCVTKCVDQCLNQGVDSGTFLRPSFFMSVSGPTGSGKTYFLKDLLTQPQFEGAQVHLFYGNEQPLYEQMTLASVRKGLDSIEAVVSDLNPQDNTIIIIDDLMEEAGCSPQVRDLGATCSSDWLNPFQM